MVAEQMRSNLKSMQIPHQESEVSEYVSISMGIASLFNNQVISPVQLLTIADQALYQAKKQGRDRASVAETK